MSEPSRASRRQQQRSGGPTPPSKRDPMTMIYASIGVLVVLIVAGLGIFRWQQQQQLNAAYATPTPAPTTSGAPTPAPLQLVDGTVVGKELIKADKKGADTASGGKGQPVDGIQCGTMEYATLHVHPHLSIFYNGTQVAVPALVGVTPTAAGGCLYWIHTHDATGLIHVEAPSIAPPGGSSYNLGMFFDIWGQPLTRTNISGLKGPVTAYVNGVKYDGDLRLIPLQSHNLITLEIGKYVEPPVYAFPLNE